MALREKSGHLVDYRPFLEGISHPPSLDRYANRINGLALNQVFWVRLPGDPLNGLGMLRLTT